jgi:dTDP-4-amino-4,6-dideoxygalactose transaminase
VDKYTWVDIGSSHVMSDLLAAVLWSQFEVADTIQARRRAIWNRYYTELKDWAAVTGSTLPGVPDDAEQAYHLFYVLLPSQSERDALIRHLRARGILAVFHYVPLHTSPMGLRFGGKPGQCPVTEDISARLIRLPFFNDLSVDDQSRVIEAVHDFGRP